MTSDIIQKYIVKISLGGSTELDTSNFAHMFISSFSIDDLTGLPHSIGVHLQRLNEQKEVVEQLVNLGAETEFHYTKPDLKQEVDLAIIVFSMHNYRSYLTLCSWISFFTHEYPYKMYLVGTVSKDKHRTISKSEVDKFAKIYGLTFFEIDLSVEENMSELKTELIHTIKKRSRSLKASQLAYCYGT